MYMIRLDSSSYTGQTVTISWVQSEAGWLESDDGLYFAFSGDGGSTWSELIEAFSNDIGSSPDSFSYAIPDTYLTNNFKMRFYLDTETSGLDPSKHQIFSVGLMIKKNNETLFEGIYYIKPQSWAEVSEEALKVNNLCLADLEERGLTEKELISQIQSVFYKYNLFRPKLIGHNVSFEGGK